MNTYFKKTIVSKSAQETMKIGEEVAHILTKGDVVAFFGELGSGKTTMIKGICKGLGLLQVVKSPSFVFLRIYENGITVYHFDFYRMKKKEELVNVGYDEFFYNHGIGLLEWADRVQEFLPESRFEIVMKNLSENEREIQISHTMDEIMERTQKKRNDKTDE